MPKAGFIVARVCFLMLAASMLGAGMLAAPATAAQSTCASSAGKCFALTVSPQGLPGSPPGPLAGARTTFTFTVTNEASTQQIGSFQITAPANFVITGASLFVNLSVAPGKSISVTVTAILPCSDSSYKWGIEVKQSNDFSGIPGNDFALDPASAGNLSGTPSGSCSLAFTSDGQPTGTAVSTPVSQAVITSGFGSSGGPVKVGLLDASGQTITTPAATGPVSVSVAITPGSNPGSGNLLGTTTMQASEGVASFSNLAIDHSGIGYRLTATATATQGQAISASAPSNYFTIFGSLKPCSGSCSASLSSKTTTGTVTTSSEPLLGAGIGGASYSCATYQSSLDSDPFSFDAFNSAGVAEQDAQFSASLDISKSVVQSSGRTSASAWQLCYASTSPKFTPLAGTAGTAMIGGVTYTTGLLPNCSTTQGPAPCVQSRKKVSGDVIITFLAVGDPFGHG
jgi:hypothetical protein